MQKPLSSGRKSGLWGASAAAILGLLIALAASIGEAEADKVGVAAAVNPDAFSALNGGAKTELSIGKSIFYNERINTTTSGLVQVLLIDGSTFTVGPGSDLVIDKFVYDPKKKTGEVVASFSKGVMRFVGGKISKNPDGVTVNTPAGTLAIRGGMFQTNGKIFSFLYGVEMNFTVKNGKTYSVYEPGYTLDLTSGTPTVRPTTAADTNAIMASLTNGNKGGLNNNQGTDPAPGTKQIIHETVSLQDLIADATATQIQSTLDKEEDKPGDTPADTTTTPADTTTTPTDTITPPDPGPTQVTARVLLSPGVYTAFPSTSAEYTTDGGDQGNGVKQGILGGGNYPEGTQPPLADDFVWTFGLANGRLVGTVSGLTDAHCNQGNCNDIQVTNPKPADVNFPAEFPIDHCVDGICAVLPTDQATVTQNGQTTTYEGLAVLKKDFFAYQLIGVPDINISETGPDTNGPSADPILVFGGKGYDFGTPSGKTYAFLLTPDVKEVLNGNGAIGPFAGGASSPVVNPDGPQPSISPLLYLEKDSAAVNDPSRAVWLQTGLYINTTPDDGEDVQFDQQSWVNVALGGVENGGLVGARRGGASVDFDSCDDGCITREAFAFTGDIATLAGPDGSHFLGKDNPNIVIGFDSTGTHNIGRDIPLDPNSSPVENQSGSTYHVGVGIGTLPVQPQTGGEFKGYAAGMVQSEVPSSGFVNVVASRDPNDFGITFDKTTNTLSANLTVRDVQQGDGATEAYNIGFGDDPESPSNKSAYIDNLHYAAIESGTPGATSVDYGDHSTYDHASSTAYLVSGDQLNVTSFFPDTFPETSPGYRPFCTGCEFLKWGAWGARVEFGNGDNPTHYVDNIHLGWWVAGDIASSTDLNELGNQFATATYNGHVIADVASNLNDYGWKTYVAAGDLAMNWSFAQRSGDLAISKFDSANFNGGLTFSGPMSAPGVAGGNHFGGPLSGQLPSDLGSLSGSAAGSFVNNGAVKAAGVIGNWNVGGDAYKATGIFAGSGTPVGHPGP